MNNRHKNFTPTTVRSSQVVLARIALGLLLLGTLPRVPVQASDVPTDPTPLTEVSSIPLESEILSPEIVPAPELPSAPALVSEPAPVSDPVSTIEPVPSTEPAPEPELAPAAEVKEATAPELQAIAAQCPGTATVLVALTDAQREAIPADVRAQLSEAGDHPLVEALGLSAATSPEAVELLAEGVSGSTEALEELSGGRGFSSTIGTPVRVGPERSRPGLGVETVFVPAHGGVAHDARLRSGPERLTLHTSLVTTETYCPAKVEGGDGGAQLFVGANDLIAYTQRVGENGAVQLKEVTLATTQNDARGSRYVWEMSLEGSTGDLKLVELSNGQVALDILHQEMPVVGAEGADAASRARAAVMKAIGDRMQLRDVERIATLALPVAVTAAGERIEGRYEVHGSKLTVAFDAAADAYPLLIDPTTDYVQWLGGDGDDQIVALASNGSKIYALGVASSPSNFTPVTFQGTFQGPTQMFLVQMDDGASPTINWGMWLGGDGNDMPHALAVNGDQVYIAASSDSPTGWDVAPNGTYSTSCLAGIIAKVIDGATPTFSWAQWVGGDGCTDLNAIVVNGTSVYAAGRSDTDTGWVDFAPTDTFVGPDEGFIVKVDDAASPTPSWAGWIGGDADDWITSMAIGNGALYIGGYTASDSNWSGMITDGAFTGIGNEGFLVKVIDGGAGYSSPWGTFLGGDGVDQVNAIAVNGWNIYAGGSSNEATGWEPASSTVGSFQGNTDGWVVKVLDSGSPTLAWHVWLGGATDDSVDALTLEGDRIYAGGSSNDATSWPSVATYGSQSADEGFVAEIDNAAMPKLAWLQWIGGSGVETLRALTVRGPLIFAGGLTDWPFDWEPFIFYGSYVFGQEGYLARLTTTPPTEVVPVPVANFIMTLEGPDTFGPTEVTTGNVAVGQVFPVSVLIQATDPTAAVSHARMKVNFVTSEFHLVDPATGDDVTSIPAGAQTVGSSNVLFQNAVNYPAAGPSNSVDNASPIGAAVLQYGANPTDADPQIYVTYDGNGLDRWVTLYFKAMSSVVNGAITFESDTPLLDNLQLLRTGDWVGFDTATPEAIYIDDDASGIVSVGDVRLTPDLGSGYAAGTTVAPGDSDEGTALSPGIMADIHFVDYDASTTWNVGEPVYQNFNFVNDWVDLNEIRIYHPSLPSGIVRSGNSDLGTGGLVHLANVRQTGTGGSGADILATSSGVQVTASSPSSVTIVTNRNCVLSGTQSILVDVTVDPVQAGVPVTLTPSDATGLTIVPLAPLQNPTTAVTDASGIAHFRIDIAGGTSTPTLTLTADAGGTVSAASSPIDLRTTACVDATQSTIVVMPACQTSNGIDGHPVTITARDSAGNLLVGMPVTVSVTGSATVTVVDSVTDAVGEAIVTITDTVAESVDVSATVDGVVVTPEAVATFSTTCVIPDAATSTVTAAPSCQVSNGSTTSTVTVTVLNAASAPIVGATVTLADSGNATVSPASVTTNASGVASFTTTNTTNETVTYTATATTGGGTAVITDTAQVQFAVTCTPGPVVSPTNSTVTATPTTCAVTGSGVGMGSTVTVAVRDTANVLVPNATVVVTPTPLTGVTVTPATLLTNASGVATFTVTSTTAQTVSLAVSANTGVGPVGITNVAPSPLQITYQATCTVPALTASTSRIDTAPLCVAPGAQTTVTVRLRDQLGAAFTGSTNVTLTAAPSSNVTFVSANPATTSTGLASFTVTSSAAQSITFTASATSGATTVSIATPTSTNGNVVLVSPNCGGVSAVNTTISSSQYCVRNDGSQSATLTVLARDISNQPINAGTVTLNVSGGNSIISPTSTLTNTSGYATFTVTNTTSQTVTYTPVVNGVTGSSATSVQFNSSCTNSSGIVDAGRSRIATDETCVLNDGDEEAEITVTARDEDGNAVSGVTVYLYQDGEADIRQSSRTTDSSGRARFTVTNETREKVTFSASASGYTIDDDVDVDFSPSCGGTTTSTSVPSSVFSTAVGDPCYNVNQGGTVAFTLRNANGDVLPGVSMRVSPSISTGVSVTPPTTTTDANGQVFVRVNSDREQTVVFSFIADDSTIGATTVYSYTGVFKTSCIATLPQTGSFDALVLATMGGLAALPPSLAAWRRRRRAAR